MSNELIQAIQLLKEKKWVDMTHTFGPNSPHFSAFEAAQFDTLFDHDQGFFAQSFKFRVNTGHILMRRSTSFGIPVIWMN